MATFYHKSNAYGTSISKRQNHETMNYLSSGTFGDASKLGHIENNMTCFDDPIFIGFTFGIDYNLSPLLYNVRQLYGMDRKETMTYLKDLVSYRYAKAMTHECQYFTNQDNVNFDPNLIAVDDWSIMSAVEYMTMKLCDLSDAKNTTDPSSRAQEYDPDKLKFDTSKMDYKNRKAMDTIYGEDQSTLAGLMKAELAKNVANTAKAISAMNKKASVTAPASSTGSENSAGSESASAGTTVTPPRLWQFITFCKQLMDIEEYTPYMISEVDGLQEVWQNFYRDDADSYTTNDDKVTLTLREGTDMKATSLVHNYRYSVMDTNNIRKTIPSNLLKFNCYIYVHSIKNFRNYYTKMGQMLNSCLPSSAINPKSVYDYTANSPDYNYDGIDSTMAYLALTHLGCIKFKFYGCEFLVTDPSDIVGSVSNREPAENDAVKLSFSYDNCDITVVSGAEILDMYRSVINKATPTEFTKDDRPIGDYYDGSPRYGYKGYIGNVYDNSFRNSLRQLGRMVQNSITEIVDGTKDIVNSLTHW